MHRLLIKGNAQIELYYGLGGSPNHNNYIDYSYYTIANAVI